MSPATQGQSIGETSPSMCFNKIDRRHTNDISMISNYSREEFDSPSNADN